VATTSDTTVNEGDTTVSEDVNGPLCGDIGESVGNANQDAELASCGQDTERGGSARADVVVVTSTDV